MKAITKNTISIVQRDDIYNRFFNDMRSIKTDYSRREQSEMIKQYKKTGCIAVRNKIIEANLLFCAKCAKVYVQDHVPSMTFGDLLSISTEAIIYALEKFEPEKGYKLISYAVIWIRQYIGKYIQKKSRAIKQHTHSDTIYKAIRQLKDKGEEITPDAVYNIASNATKRNFKIDTVKHIMLTMNIDSLDANKLGCEGKTLHDFVGTEELSPDAAHKECDRHARILSCMQHLKKKEQEVITLHFGLYNHPPTSFTDIAYSLGLTVEAVRQRYLIAIKRLEYYAKKGGMQPKLF